MIKREKLDNGLELVSEIIPYVQSVSIGIWVKTGAVNENTKTAGISHLIEHMLFKGTEKRTAKEIAEDVDKIGGQINAFTGKEATCYYLKTLSSNVEKACDILCDMFLNSKFDKKELEKEKKVIYEEMKMIEDSPEDLAHDIISELIFKGMPLANSIIGTKSSLQSITQNTIRKYIEDQYTADRIVISVAGNFDEKVVKSFFQKKLGGLKKKTETQWQAELQYAPSYKVKTKEVEQSHLCIGVPSIKISDDRYYVMSLLTNILGGSMSSRLFQNIREQKGLAYSVYAFSSSYIHSGYFNIYAGVSHQKVEEALGAIGEELQLLKDSGVTKSELEIAKEQLKGTYTFSMENVNSRMFTNGKNILVVDRTYTLEEIINNVDNVTLDQMSEMAEMITDLSQYSGVLVSPEKVNLKKVLKCN